MILPGLISVTFRERTIEQIAELAAGCGLLGIDWGADVHVRPGDDAAADRAVAASDAHGLTVTGYGSYHRAGADPIASFAPVVATAVRLGAPLIRIWAGAKGSASADAAYRASVTDGIAGAVELAKAEGIQVALEFHGETLTDTPAGAVALCDATGARSHWQPPVGLADDDALAGLDAVAGHLAQVHVFSWGARAERQPLGARRALWSTALARVAVLPGDHAALLEFVAADDPANLRADAATLLDLLAEVA
jgi:3-dehydroshikimate dehydratase